MHESHEVMAAKTVFFSRCKPCGVDAIEIVLKHRCVFIGYTMRKAGVPFCPGDVRQWMVDVSCSDSEWERHFAARIEKFPQHTQNRNLARRVQPGSIVMVPRPAHGVIYCGRTTGSFRVSYDESRSNRFVELFKEAERRDLSADEVNWVHGEVCQGWDVDEFIAIPVPQVPAWIRRSLFGRSTYGVIRADEIAGDPHAHLSALMISPGFSKRPWSIDPDVVRRRLLDTVTPEIFEHLIVALLQLEQPDFTWLSVGGSGDGGIDGIGADDDGRVVGLLQCKWRYGGERVFWSKPANSDACTYLAVLQGPSSAKSGADVVLDGAWVVDAILKHHRSLPLAATLRIGGPRPQGSPASQ